jgi:hypothetical protein
VALGYTCAAALPDYLAHRTVHYFTATKLLDNEVEKKRIEEGRSKQTEIEAQERTFHLVMDERARTGDIGSGNGSRWAIEDRRMGTIEYFSDSE